MKLPDRIKKYRIDEKLGEGGMGVVYHGFDIELKRPVALKLIREDRLTDERSRERFLREAQNIAKLNHPSIVQIYDLFEWEERPIIVMEFVEGEDLERLLARKGRLSVARVLPLAHQLAEGLAAAHAQGIVHRDLKPGNIMLAAGVAERAKLLDFGLAKFLFEETDLTEDRIIGTPRYMSPEQARAGELGPSSDFFSLGVVIYRALSGNSPFTGREFREIERQIAHHLPDPLADLDSTIPKSLSLLVNQLLQKDPELRPASADQIAATLAALLVSWNTGRQSMSAAIDSDELTVDLRSDVGGPQEGRAALRVLLAWELEDRGELNARHGDERMAGLRRRLEEMLQQLIDEHEGAQGTTPADGRMLLFYRPIHAVACALALHEGVAKFSEAEGIELRVKIGLHLGEVIVDDSLSGSITIEGLATIVAARLMLLAEGGQILLSQATFELARHGATTEDENSPQWRSHGKYRIEGVERALEVFEVGDAELAPLCAPSGTERVRREVDQEVVPGWRPAPGLELPERPNFYMVNKIGEGGSGEVWLARSKAGEARVFKFCWDVRNLRSLEREVTLFRLLQGELGTRDDIARIIDWHLTDSPPYFIEAEYTDSGNLIDWIEEQGGFDAVSMETRLEIVAQVADALAAAHAVGVLHKDVKPANILIKNSMNGPRAQLTDFGIGRLVDTERLEGVDFTVLGMTGYGNTALTDVSDGSGTRLYMAPELIEGKAATLQADIYALGVTLYQLVREDFSCAVAPGWERDVGDEILREDLAAVVDGSRDRRLGDASQLAERLRGLNRRRKEREAELRQVEEARRAQIALERFRAKWRIGAVMMALLVVFSLSMVRLWQRAENEAETARQVTDLVTGIFEQSNPSDLQNSDLTMRDFLDLGADRIDEELLDRPIVRARMKRVIGNAYLGLGLHERAEAFLQDSLAIYEANPSRNQVDLAKLNSSLGNLNLAKSRLDAAVQLHRKTVGSLFSALGSDHPDVAVGYYGLAQALQEREDYEESEGFYTKSLSILQKHPERAKDYALALDGYALLLNAQGRSEDADRMFRDAIDLLNNLLAPDHPLVARVLNSIGISQIRRGEYDEATKTFERVLDARRTRFGKGHPLYAQSLGNLALSWLYQGECDSSEPLVREAVKVSQNIFGRNHPRTLIELDTLATVLQCRDNHEEATVLLYEIIGFLEENEGRESFACIYAIRNLGKSQHKLGLHEDAEKSLQEAVGLYISKLGENHRAVAMVWMDLASLARSEGRFKDAEKYGLDALRVRQDLNENQLSIADAELLLAEIYVDQDICGRAAEAARRALERYREHSPDDRERILEAEKVLENCS